ncbi:MAG: hypothetical protein DIU78_009915 [Pseudomonadota bacterium]|nr:MAG: hypothetical protein DIU78_04245 [Pseudomonadota bacterium]
MSCCVGTHSAQRRRRAKHRFRPSTAVVRRAVSALPSAGLEGAAEPASEGRPVEITGTWDFKWPLGTEIRVAFQKPPASMGLTPKEFTDAKGIVKDLAASWKLPPSSGIRFCFLDEDLEPPLGIDNSFTDQHRSPFLPDTPEKIPYDVLISLEDLPVLRVDPFRGAGAEIEEVVFPVSDLGSYARRADYGAPTTYIGRFGVFKEASLLDYLQSPVGRHVVVHELGHVLGLPHLHQHPDLLPACDREKFYKPLCSIVEIMEKQLGVEVTKKIVHGHLIDPWPGSPDYSDWVELTQEIRDAHQRDGTLASVMTMPNYACLLRNGSPCPASGALPDQIIQEPGALDEEMLKRMYDPFAQL